MLWLAAAVVVFIIAVVGFGLITLALWIVDRIARKHGI